MDSSQKVARGIVYGSVRDSNGRMTSNVEPPQQVTLPDYTALNEDNTYVQNEDGTVNVND